MAHVVIIGGSDTGISAALRIKELNPMAEVTIVVADAFPAYSICGLPFFLSQEVTDWRRLAHHNEEEFVQQGIRLLLNQRAEVINPQDKTVRIVSREKQASEIGYDKLLIATGAESARPPINGLDQPGIFFLRTMTDGFTIDYFIASRDPHRAIIIGGGYIGLEMADSLTRRGLEVTIVVN
jgi:NADPH-dependent 2,4-dienoyl-CoA reductase/sulfur reductase-like enzyme